MFESVNELDKFIYDDCVVKEFEYIGDRIKIVLDALIVSESNSQNTNFTKSYADSATMVLSNASIEKIILAGYKEYNADDELVNSVEDVTIPSKDYPEIIEKLADTYMYRMMYMSKDGDVYRFDAEFETMPEDPAVPDLRSDTYVISLAFDKAVVSFERYLNRVQQ